jgi:phage terminase large subunit GpA-like protein
LPTSLASAPSFDGVDAADAAIAAAVLDGLCPPPSLTVSAWADEHRVLSGRSSAEPGRWKTARAPYLREPFDCLSATSLVRRVVVMKAAQLGFTEGAVNWLGYVIHHAPAPFLFVQPTVDLAKRLSRQRIDPAIAEAPELRERVAPARSQPDSGSNTVLLKEFPGGLVALTGANSAAGLSSISARNLALDEIDRFPGNVEDEGDPIGLVEARARTFGARRKALLMSTPTIAGTSRIEREFLATDQRRYYVPCPACDAFQVLTFPRLEWEPGNPKTARYRCEACGTRIREAAKTRMLARGEWRATAPSSDPTVAGFHVNALYCPVGWLSWPEIAEAAEKAAKDPQLQQTFENTILGEPYAARGDAPDWHRLRDRATSDPLGTVPAGALFLTAGVDVQRDRIEVSVWGWGRGRRSWLVDHRVLEGDTAGDVPWAALTELVAATYPVAGGALGMPLARVAIDTGHATTVVHAWARNQPTGRVVLVRGGGSGPALVALPRAAESVEHSATPGRRRRRARGLRVWQVNVHAIQTETYGWLHLDAPAPGAPTPAGWVAIPAVGDEWLKQLCAKALVRTIRKGVERSEWVNVYRRDEATDCRNYARAAAHLVGLDRFGEDDWRRLEIPLGIDASAPPDDPHVSMLGDLEIRRGDAAQQVSKDATPPTGSAPSAVPLPGAAAPVGWRRSSWWDRRRR